ncbi:MAG: AMP-binding protein, partial [bacterium]
MTSIQVAASIPEALERSAATGSGVTLIDRQLTQRRFSYEEILESGLRVASGLRDRGVGRGDRVCLLGPTTVELVAALYGTWLAGAAPVVLPLPRRQSELPAFISDVADRVRRSQAAVLAVSELLLDQA